MGPDKTSCSPYLSSDSLFTILLYAHRLVVDRRTTWLADCLTGDLLSERAGKGEKKTIIPMSYAKFIKKASG